MSAYSDRGPGFPESPSLYASRLEPPKRSCGGVGGSSEGVPLKVPGGKRQTQGCCQVPAHPSSALPMPRLVLLLTRRDLIHHRMLPCEFTEAEAPMRLQPSMGFCTRLSGVSLLQLDRTGFQASLQALTRAPLPMVPASAFSRISRNPLLDFYFPQMVPWLGKVKFLSFLIT